jgi:hypothetical protein
MPMALEYGNEDPTILANRDALRMPNRDQVMGVLQDNHTDSHI